MTDYDALRAAAEAATPGPWKFASTLEGGHAIHHGEHDTVALYANRGNARYIAAASPDVVLGLLDELAAAEADYRAVSDSLDAIMDRLEVAEAKVAAVEGLHHPLGLVFADRSTAGRICDRCDEQWPCATARALSEALRGPDATATERP